MRTAICGAAALSLVLALGASAQGHSHGARRTGDTARAADTTQGMMQQKMQGMQQRMQDMQARMEGVMQMRSQGQAMAGTCIMSGSGAALSAVLFGSVSALTLSEEQTETLHEILERAQHEALEALTPEQRERLEGAPARPMCRQLQPDAEASASR
jgi:DNA-binding protein YbaB